MVHIRVGVFFIAGPVVALSLAQDLVTALCEVPPTPTHPSPSLPERMPRRERSAGGRRSRISSSHSCQCPSAKRCITNQSLGHDDIATRLVWGARHTASLVTLLEQDATWSGQSRRTTQWQRAWQPNVFFRLLPPSRGSLPQIHEPTFVDVLFRACAAITGPAGAADLLTCTAKPIHRRFVFARAGASIVHAGATHDPPALLEYLLQAKLLTRFASREGLGHTKPRWRATQIGATISGFSNQAEL